MVDRKLRRLVIFFLATVLLILLAVATGAQTLVVIDIKPSKNDRSNDINPFAGGNVAVAILTTSTANGEPLDFDATTVDQASVRFGPAGAVPDGEGKLKDVDQDKDLDMILQFRIRDTGIACRNTQAILTGSTFDGQSVIGSDTIVTVNCEGVNDLPVANAGPDQTAYVGDTVLLDGTGSTDVNGDPLTYQWSWVSAPSGSSAIVSGPSDPRAGFLIDLPGSYVVQLIVNDGYDDSAPDTIIVGTLNSAPVADAGSDQTVYVGELVQLDGSGSYDVDGDLLTYDWNLLRKPEGSSTVLSDAATAAPTVLIDYPGTYNISLLVNDGEFDSAVDIVIVATMNSAPVANAGPDQVEHSGYVINLDGVDSYDVDFDALSYRWAMLRKPESSTAELLADDSVTPSFFADEVGTYVVQLIVDDGIVDSEPDTTTIDITEGPTDWRLVGPQGGTLIFDNGIVFDIPAGAVSQNVVIRLGDLPFADVQSLLDARVYRSSAKTVLAGFAAEPDGLVFNVPVKVTLPIQDPSGIPMQAVVDLDAQEYWLSPTDMIYDPATGLAEITLTHFSGHPMVDILGADVELPEGCAEQRIRVKSTSTDFARGSGCQLVGDTVKVTFLDCPGQPTQGVRISETTPECGEDFTLNVDVHYANVKVCRSTRMGATVTDQNGNEWEVPLSWQSLNQSIAPINEVSGIATGMSKGLAGIRATVLNSDFQGQGWVNVTDPYPIDIEPQTPSIEVGESITLAARDESGQVYECDRRTADGATFWREPVTWSSHDPSIADVPDPQYGQVTGISPGEVKIIARSVSVTGSTTVEVTGGDCDLSFIEAEPEIAGWPAGRPWRYHENEAARTLEPGWTLQLEAVALDWSTRPPRNPVPHCISDEWLWSSSDESVATVDSTGLVTAVSTGKATIRIDHIQHPEIMSYWTGIDVNESWVEFRDSGRPRDVSFFWGILCSIGGGAGDPGSWCPGPLDIPDYTGWEMCLEWVPAGMVYQCHIAANPYADPGCEIENGHFDPLTCNAPIVEVRKAWSVTTDYYEMDIDFKDETAMQKWWMGW